MTEIEFFWSLIILYLKL